VGRWSAAVGARECGVSGGLGGRASGEFRGKLFYRPLEQAAAVEPVPCNSLVKWAGRPDSDATTSSGRLSEVDTYLL
jgi:hypothetical protein